MWDVITDLTEMKENNTLDDLNNMDRPQKHTNGQNRLKENRKPEQIYNK